MSLKAALVLREDRLWRAEGGAIAGVIYGPVPNKSNSRKIGLAGGQGGRPIIMKSAKALTFARRFAAVVLASRYHFGPFLPLVGATCGADLRKGVPLLYLTAMVHGDFVRDLDVELLPDLLQNNGLINNDRAIRRKYYDWRYDTTVPRMEFEIGFLRPTS